MGEIKWKENQEHAHTHTQKGDYEQKEKSVFEALEREGEYVYGYCRFLFWLQTMQLLSELNKKKKQQQEQNNREREISIVED